PSVQRVLEQYEALVNLSNVKYKPSDALKPEEQPSNLFEKLLQSERSQTLAARASAPPAPSVAALAAASAGNVPAAAAARPAAEPQAGPKPAKTLQCLAQELAEEAAAEAAAEDGSAPRISAAILAYISAAARTDLLAAQAPVSQVA